MKRYLLRYTNDCHVIETSNQLHALKRGSDYKIHIWDVVENRCVWQNSPSIRFGNTGIEVET